MRIKIIGENDCARATRALLRQAGYAVTEFLPADAVIHAPQAGYVLTIESHAQPEIILDSADSPLEAAILRHIAQLSKLPVIVDRPGGVIHSDREIRILAPENNPAQATAVEYGILRALLDLAGPKIRGAGSGESQPPSAPPRKSGWLGKLLPTIFCTVVAALPPALFAAGVAFATLTFPLTVNAAPAPSPAPAPALTRAATASNMVSLHGRDAENNLLALAISPSGLYPQLQQGASQANIALIGGAPVSSALYDSANNALLVHCVVGCSSSSGFSDNSAFTVGSTAINVIGAYYTTGGAPTISTGDAGRVRMDASSYLYVDCVTGCSASAGFADNGAFTAGTTPINLTGGWYSTSPTNCTSGNACAPQLTADRKLFVQAFQGTSPWVVSANGGSFAVTQSGTWTVQPGNTANTTAWLVTGAGGTFPVTGTFWQTTQPVSWSGQSVTATQSSGANLHVDCDSGCSSSAGFADNSAFTVGTTPINILGGYYTSGSAPTLSSGNAGRARIDANSYLLVDVENSSLAVTGTFWQATQPASCTAANCKVDVNGNAGAAFDQAPGSAAPASAVQVGATDGTNTRVEYMDPCKFNAWTYYVVNVSANTQIVAGSASKNVYICKEFIQPAAAAANVELVESATSGNACATSPTGMMGGNTAALGGNLAVNGGFVLPADGRAWAKTATTADAVCIFASAQVTGVIAYVQF